MNKCAYLNNICHTRKDERAQYSNISLWYSLIFHTKLVPIARVCFSLCSFFSDAFEKLRIIHFCLTWSFRWFFEICSRRRLIIFLRPDTLKLCYFPAYFIIGRIYPSEVKVVALATARLIFLGVGDALLNKNWKAPLFYLFFFTLPFFTLYFFLPFCHLGGEEIYQ